MTAQQSNSIDAVRSAERLPIITPETGHVGASITGLDLTAEHSPQIQKVLVDALHTHGVLFVRTDGGATDEDQKRLGRVFGELHGSYYNHGADPLVAVLDSTKMAGPKYGTDIWHTDVAVSPTPPRAALLRAITLPEAGGDTIWASMYAAYETLSSKMQRFLDGLEALHSTDTVLRARPAAKEDNLFGEAKSAVHPVVIRDPVTGKPALYVNQGYTEKIIGLSDAESASVLKMLFDHVNTPDFHVRLKWDLRTVVVWEERVTQHRAINDYTGRRILHRVVANGDAPQAYGQIIRDDTEAQ